MLFSGLGHLLNFARDTQDLYALQAKFKDALTALDDRLRTVEDRVLHLEASQNHVISEAKSAATGAATLVASAVVSDAVTRVTRVEEGIRRLTTSSIRVEGERGPPL